MIDVIMLCALFGIFILVSFIKGIQIGIKLRKDEPIEVQSPITYVKEKIQENKDNKIIEKEQEITQINLDNIDSYDGRGIGQKDIPR